MSTSEAESPQERLVPNWEGALIGRYRIGPRLGAGGMGQVHLALMTGAAGFSRVVAIKRLHSEYSQDPRMRARFEQEVRLSARIVHPNVVQVLDVLRDGDDLMFVMEYLAGDTLRGLRSAASANGEPLALDIATGLIVPALHGLHAAHETRDAEGKRLLLVHRDFSPDNLMVGPDGEVKVLDFGIAKAAQEVQTTRPGTVAGKPCYMSPEQALGLPLDARSDVFSAGAVLWELLTGERLFRSSEASPAAVLLGVIQAEIPPPSSRRKDIPPALERAVMRALERDVDARFASALEFAMALEAALPPASPFNVGQALRRFCARTLSERAASLERFRCSLPEPARLEMTGAFALGTVSETVPLWESDTFGGLPLSSSSPTARSARGPKWTSVGKAIGVAALASTAVIAGWRWLQTSLSPPRAGSGSDAPAAMKGGAAGGIVRVQEPIPVPQATPAPLPSEAPSSPSRAPAPRSEDDARPRRRVIARQPSSAAADCSPPTYVDADGIRHFKPQCL